MNQFAVVELLGHNRHVGFVTEVEMFGGKMGRVEALQPDGVTTITTHFTSASVYRITPTTEELAREMVKPYEYKPLSIERGSREDVDESDEDFNPFRDE